MIHLTKRIRRAAIAVTLAAAMAAGGVGFAGAATAATDYDSNVVYVGHGGGATIDPADVYSYYGVPPEQRPGVDFWVVLNISESAGATITAADVYSYYGVPPERRAELALWIGSPYGHGGPSREGSFQVDADGRFVSFHLVPACDERNGPALFLVTNADATLSQVEGPEPPYGLYVLPVLQLFRDAAPCTMGTITARSYDIFAPAGGTSTITAGDLVSAAVSGITAYRTIRPTLDLDDQSTWDVPRVDVKHHVSLVSPDPAVTTATDPDGYVTALTYHGTPAGASVEYRIDDEAGAFQPSTGVITFYSDPAIPDDAPITDTPLPEPPAVEAPERFPVVAG